MLHLIQSTAINQLERGSATAPACHAHLMHFQPGGGSERLYPAFRAIAARQAIPDIAPIGMGEVRAILANPAQEMWDPVLLIRYPLPAAFRTIVESEACRADAAPHRKAALRDWCLGAQT